MTEYKCEGCGESIAPYERIYMVDGKPECKKCLSLDKTKPYFITEIPTYVDGGTYKIFTFTDEKRVSFLI